MKKTTTRVLLAVLAAVMVLGCFAGCSNGKKKPAGTTEPVDTTPPEIPYELPLRDFENETVTFLTPYPKIWQFDYEWWYNSDQLNIGLFNRDTKLEEVLNCDLEYIYQTDNGSGMPATFDTLLTQEQLAATGAYDVVYHLREYGLDFKGYFYNLYDAELSTVVNLDQPFYFNMWNDISTIDGILVSAFGYGTVEMMSSATVTIFNHSWWNSLFDGDIYDYVYDGDWTLELMTTMAKQANVDRNENGMNLEEGDKFGFGYMGQANGMFYTMGGKYFTRDADGELKYDFLSESNTTIYEALYDLVHDNDCVYLPGYTEASPAYHAEQVLFLLGYFDCAKVIKKDGDTEFGFLPNPKLNAADEYKSTIIGGGIFSIPKTATDKMLSGVLLNAYQYYTFEKVRPAYFDSLLKLQLSKDPDSSYVVDVCMNNLTIDFAQIHSSALASCGGLYWSLILNDKDGQYVSEYLKIMKNLDESLDLLIEDFKANNS